MTPGDVRDAIVAAGQGRYLGPIVSSLPSDRAMELLPAAELADAHIRAGVDMLRGAAARAGVTWGARDAAALVDALAVPVVEIGAVVSAVQSGRSPDRIQVASAVTAAIGAALTAAAAFSSVPIVGWIAAAVTAIAAGAIALARWLRKRNKAPVWPTMRYDHDEDERIANLLLDGLVSDDWTWFFSPRHEPGVWEVHKAEGVGLQRVSRVWRIGVPSGAVIGGGVRGWQWEGGAQQWSWQSGARRESLAEYASQRMYSPLSSSVAATAWEQAQAPSRQRYAVDWYAAESRWADWLAAAPRGVQRGAAAVVNYDGLRAAQMRGLDTLLCAYASETDPAFGDAVMRARLQERRVLLLGHAARWRVDLASVPDVDYREALFRSRLGLAAPGGSSGSAPGDGWDPGDGDKPRLPPLPSPERPASPAATAAIVGLLLRLR